MNYLAKEECEALIGKGIADIGFLSDKGLQTAPMDKSLTFESIMPAMAKDEDIFMNAHEMVVTAPVHRHEFYELTYVYQGTLVNCVDGKELYMKQGNLCIMGLGTSHTLYSEYPNTVLINFGLSARLFQRDFFGDLYGESGAVSQLLRGEGKRPYLFFTDTVATPLESLVFSAVRSYVHAGFRQSVELVAEVLYILCVLNGISTYTYEGVDCRTLLIIERIYANPATASVSGVASEFGYSSNYFTQLMKRKTGRRAVDIIRDARLDCAAELLKSSDMSVASIGRKVGYDSRGHFHDLFRSRFGLTPAQYRRESA